MRQLPDGPRPAQQPIVTAAGKSRVLTVGYGGSTRDPTGIKATVPTNQEGVRVWCSRLLAEGPPARLRRSQHTVKPGLHAKIIPSFQRLHVN